MTRYTWILLFVACNSANLYDKDPIPPSTSSSGSGGDGGEASGGEGGTAASGGAATGGTGGMLTGPCESLPVASSCVPPNAPCPSGMSEAPSATCNQPNHKCCAEDGGGGCTGVNLGCSDTAECCAGLQCDTNFHLPDQPTVCCVPDFTQPCTATEECCLGTCIGGSCITEL